MFFLVSICFSWIKIAQILPSSSFKKAELICFKQGQPSKEWYQYVFLASKYSIYFLYHFLRKHSSRIVNKMGLKLVDQFTCLGNNISSIESNTNISISKAWRAIVRLRTIWKSDLCDKIKQDFFQTVVVLVLLYSCTTCALMKYLEKKLHLDSTCYFQQILEETPYNTVAVRPLASHLTNHQGRWTKHAGHCWRSKWLLWTSTHRNICIGQRAKTYIHLLCADTGYSLQDQPRQMNDRDGWREIQNSSCYNHNDIYIYIYIYIYICIYISSSSSHSASTDFPDTISPFVSIIHCSWQVF